MVKVDIAFCNLLQLYNCIVGCDGNHISYCGLQTKKCLKANGIDYLWKHKKQIGKWPLGMDIGDCGFRSGKDNHFAQSVIYTATIKAFPFFHTYFLLTKLILIRIVFYITLITNIRFTDQVLYISNNDQLLFLPFRVFFATILNNSGFL